MIGNLAPGRSFEASAHPFAEYSLSEAGEELLRLRYVQDADAERDGGMALQTVYSGQRWNVRFFRTRFLQRVSYRVMRDGDLILTTDSFWPFKVASITCADGTIWRCKVRFVSMAVNDINGVRMLHTYLKIGLIMGRSVLQIDKEMEEDKGLALLLALTHFTTHRDQ